MENSIKHMVIFSLKDTDQANVEYFLDHSRKVLSNIPGVKDFEVSKQVSLKNSFQYGFSMLFGDEAKYKAYNEHPDHIDYVKNIWLNYVKEFLEIDFKLI